MHKVKLPNIVGATESLSYYLNNLFCVNNIRHLWADTHDLDLFLLTKRKKSLTEGFDLSDTHNTIRVTENGKRNQKPLQFSKLLKSSPNRPKTHWRWPVSANICKKFQNNFRRKYGACASLLLLLGETPLESYLEYREIPIITPKKQALKKISPPNLCRI